MPEVSAYVARGRKVAVGPSVEPVYDTVRDETGEPMLNDKGAALKKFVKYRPIEQKYASEGDKVTLPKEEVETLVKEGFLVMNRNDAPAVAYAGPTVFQDSNPVRIAR